MADYIIRKEDMIIMGDKISLEENLVYVYKKDNLIAIIPLPIEIKYLLSSLP